MRRLTGLFILLLFGVATAAASSRMHHLSPADLKLRADRHLDAGRVDSALFYYTEINSSVADDDASGENLTVLVNSLIAGAHIYTHGRIDFPKAYNLLDRVRRIARREKMDEALMIANLDMANIYLRQSALVGSGATDGMRDLYTEAMRIAVRLKKPVTASVIAVNNIGFAIQSCDFSISDSVVAIARSAGMRLTPFARELFSIGEDVKRGEYEPALAKFDGLEQKISDDEERPRHIYNVRYLRGLMEMRAGNPDEARATFLSLVPYVMSNGLQEALPEIYQALAEIFRGKGEEAIARQYELEKYRAQDSLAATQCAGAIEEMRFSSELDQMERQYITASARAESDRRRLVAVLAAAAVVLLLLCLLVSQYRKLRRAYRALYEKSRIPAPANTAQLGDTGRRVLSKIEQAMDGDEILRQDFGLDDLARLVDEDPREVSAVINGHLSSNFYTLLAEHRIRRACRRLADGDKYTVEAVAESVGFKSRSNFVAVFKRVTGFTPSQYRKMAKEDTKS